MVIFWKKSHSYTLKSLLVKEFASTKFLSMARDGSEIVSIPDIGEVLSDSDDDQNETITNVQIIGVLQLDSYKSCLRCKARVESTTPPLGRCTKSDCAMLQRFDICAPHMSAKLLLMSGINTYSLYAYGNIIKELASDNDIIETALLNVAKLLNITFDKNNFITHFEH